MTDLLVWRNPEGADRNWLRRAPHVDMGDRINFLARIAITEIGLLYLAFYSAFEACCTCLALTCLAFPMAIGLGLFAGDYTMIEDMACLAQKIDSAVFTLIWSLFNALIGNFCFTNLLTHESTARYFSLIFRTRTDSSYYGRLFLPDPGLAVPGPAVPGLAPVIPNTPVQEGTGFLLSHVLVNMPAEVKRKIEECDVDVYMPVLLKAVYIYAAGSRKDCRVPFFFKGPTRTMIQNFREKWPESNRFPILENQINAFTEFEGAPPKNNLGSFLQDLREIASSELQGGLLVTSCWQQVLNSPDFS